MWWPLFPCNDPSQCWNFMQGPFWGYSLDVCFESTLHWFWYLESLEGLPYTRSNSSSQLKFVHAGCVFMSSGPSAVPWLCEGTWPQNGQPWSRKNGSGDVHPGQSRCNQDNMTCWAPEASVIGRSLATELYFLSVPASAEKSLAPGHRYPAEV